MNYYFFRRVSSYILTSLLAFGIFHKSVNAEDTKTFTFCQQYKTLFHLNEGAERKVRITVLDIDIISPTSISDQFSQEKYVFRGIGKILANELAKTNNFSIVSWSQISPKSLQRGVNLPIPQKSITIEHLRNLRNKYGIEAVLIGTINYLEFDGERGKSFLGFGKTKKDNQVEIQVSFSAIDTSTGDVVIPIEGKGNGSKTYTDITIPNINVKIQNSLNRHLDINNNSWTSRTRGSTIEFTLNSNDEPQTIVSSDSDNILQKLLALAVEDSIKQISTDLNTRSHELACLLRKPTLIADVDKYDRNQVILNKGKLHGYCRGMTFSIERFPQPVKDPATGRILRIKTEKVGYITLSEVDSYSSVGKGTVVLGKYFRLRDIAKLTNPSCLNQSNKNSDSLIEKAPSPINSIEFNRNNSDANQ
ncbi:hypothetical protein NIES267_15250 [Calothrix parasitica NIES-267]|uniref:FlgO domain-containing protein n=1 Tax=Calothrix parasitica NIES-267 TaxID=1973488 RepID=A0A1Z4LLC5_9CYAN|nr:hypothetical protein NIES267_15250 [Calothrix parasitica NIES-267]